MKGEQKFLLNITLRGEVVNDDDDDAISKRRFTYYYRINVYICFWECEGSSTENAYKRSSMNGSSDIWSFYRINWYFSVNIAVKKWAESLFTCRINHYVVSNKLELEGIH